MNSLHLTGVINHHFTGHTTWKGLRRKSAAVQSPLLIVIHGRRAAFSSFVCCWRSARLICRRRQSRSGTWSGGVSEVLSINHMSPGKIWSLSLPLSLKFLRYTHQPPRNLWTFTIINTRLSSSFIRGQPKLTTTTEARNGHLSWRLGINMKYFTLFSFDILFQFVVGWWILILISGHARTYIRSSACGQINFCQRAGMQFA